MAALAARRHVFQGVTVAKKIFARQCVRTVTVIPQVNPQTGVTFHEYETISDNAVQNIVDTAHTAYGSWRKLDVATRAETLAVLAEKLRSSATRTAELVHKEMGKPVAQARAEVMKSAGLVDWCAKHAAEGLAPTEHVPLPGYRRSYVAYQPLGVILSIMPWNFPVWQVFRMAVPAMIAGNAVLLKHAPNCFGTALICEELFGEVPGLPEGLFRSLIIDVPQVDAVLEHNAVRGVAFTGSVPTGRKVAARAGSLLKKAVVELGGSDPYVVLADADLAIAAGAIVDARIMNAGQVCIAPKRVIAHRSIKAELEQAILTKLGTKAYGKDYGPLVNAGAREQVARQVQRSQDAGAKLLMGGVDAPVPEGDSGGAFMAPTVLTDVKPGMVAFDDEIFGPVISIVEAEDEASAIQLANQSEFGLGGAVFTKDIAKGEHMAAHEIDVGMCFVNDFVRSDPSLPFGGVKNSGIGRECSLVGLREFTNIKTICVK